MEDRNSRYPGRVKLIPVPGQANVYDTVRADQPIVNGTPYSKATTIPDDVANAYGVPSKSATIADIFRRLLPMCQRRWHLLQDWTATQKMPGIGLTLGTGYSRYLLELDIVSASGVDAQLRISFGRDRKYTLTKANAAHNEPGRDTRIRMEMIPGSYPHIEIADADKAYSGSYIFVARNPENRQDWADAMDYINVFVDGAHVAPKSRIKAWGWR